jgi:2-polyprenyl-3-methyl-5-hydroxy-6-metoxy-1,4-benzoquinol methylase
MKASPYVVKLARELHAGLALDVGAGHGRNVQALAAAGWQVDALEADDALTADLRSAGASTVRIQDVATCRLPRGRYNLVICNMVLHFLEGKQQVRDSLKRIRSSVAPGGVVYLATFTSENEEQLRRSMVSVGELLVPFDGWELHLVDCTRTSRALLLPGRKRLRASACRLVLRRPRN